MSRNILASLLMLSAASACGDDGGDSNGDAKANPRIHDYCEANCAKNTECKVESLFEDSECVTLCEGFTIAYGKCEPTQAQTDACIQAIEKNTCEAQKNDEEPEECDALCQE